MSMKQLQKIYDYLQDRDNWELQERIYNMDRNELFSVFSKKEITWFDMDVRRFLKENEEKPIKNKWNE